MQQKYYTILYSHIQYCKFIMYHYYVRPQQKSKNILTEKNKPKASANPRPKNPRDHFLDSSLISSGFENIYICKDDKDHNVVLKSLFN